MFINKMVNFIVSWMTEHAVLVSLILLCFTTVWIYLRYKLSYWQRRGIPCHIRVSDDIEAIFKRTSIAEQNDRKYWSHREALYVGICQFFQSSILVRDLDIVKRILIKDFDHFVDRRPLLKEHSKGNEIFGNFLTVANGDKWKNLRSAVSPTFTTKKVRTMSNLVLDCLKSLNKILSQKADLQEEVEMNEMVTLASTDAIAASIFGLNSQCLQGNKAFSNKLKAVNTFGWRFIVFIFLPKLASLVKISIIHPGAMKFFQNVVDTAIEGRKKENKKGDDFIQQLIDISESSEGVHKDVNEDEDAKLHHSVNIKDILTKEIMASQAVLFLIAGFDTVQVCLTWTILELVKNQHIQQLLIEEVVEVIKKHGPLDYNSAQEMIYLDCVIKESLRMHSPASMTERLCTKDYKIDETLTIPKGMMVNIPIHSIHTDPRYYDEPLKFKPERWRDTQDRHSMAWLAFGAGPRNCIGLRFALMEVKLVLASIFSEFKLLETDKTPKVLEIDPKKFSLTSPKGGAWVKIVKHNLI